MAETDPWVELLDSARAGEARASRARRRWLEAAATEGATLAGVLLDLVGRDDLVTIGIEGGTAVSAEVLGVGADVVVLDRRTGPLTLVPLRRVTTVRTSGGTPLGDRPTPDAPRLVDLLARSGERDEVVVLHLLDRTVVSGTVDAAGADVVLVQPEDRSLGPTYVSVASIGEAVVFRSG